MCGRCSGCHGCGGGIPRPRATATPNVAVAQVRRSPVVAAMSANGNDRAARVAYGMATFGPKVETANPRMNQSESGRAIFTDQGAALQGASARTVRQMAPLFKATKYRGFVGGFIARSARQVPVITQPGYAGTLPLAQQPKINKPYPYSLGPLRGAQG